MEVEYEAACELVKKEVWLRKLLMDLEVILNMHMSIMVYCDNNGAIANSKGPQSHKRGN